MNIEKIEEAAREYRKSTFIGRVYDDYHRETAEEGFIEGAKWREESILKEASDSFDGWFENSEDFEIPDPRDLMKHVWQAARLSSLKQLAQKDEEILSLWQDRGRLDDANIDLNHQTENLTKTVENYKSEQSYHREKIEELKIDLEWMMGMTFDQKQMTRSEYDQFEDIRQKYFKDVGDE